MGISAVIVTYNRKQLLTRCVDAVLGQSIPPDHLFVVDNASTDGTRAYLDRKGYLTGQVDARDGDARVTKIHYIRLEENTGGAGGFHEGIRQACRPETGYVWIMDDDGYPSEQCLERLLAYTGTHDYIMPVSLDTGTPDKLTWFIRKKNRKRTRSYRALAASFNSGVMKTAVPFNGLLMSRKLIDAVGLPKKEMFVWGDDWDHQYRCRKAGFDTITVLDALFYHPEDKAAHYRICFGLVPVNFTESKLRFTCLIRNSTYNYWNYIGRYRIILKWLIYSWFFIITRRFDIQGYTYYLKCVADGIRGDFSRHRQYLK